MGEGKQEKKLDKTSEINSLKSEQNLLSTRFTRRQAIAGGALAAAGIAGGLVVGGVAGYFLGGAGAGARTTTMTSNVPPTTVTATVTATSTVSPSSASTTSSASASTTISSTSASTSTSSSSSSSTATSTATTNPAGSGTIQYYTPFGSGPFSQWELNAQVAWQKANPSEPVNIVSNSNYVNELTLGVPIDIAQSIGGGVQYTLPAQGLVVKRDDSKWVYPYQSDLEPCMHDLLTFFGQEYNCMPFNVSPRGLLFNKTIYGSNLPDNITYPATTTWADLIPVLQKVQNPPTTYGLGLSGDGGTARWEFQQIARGFGAETVLESATAPFHFYTDLDSSAGQATFQFYYDIVNTYKITPISAAVGGPTTDGAYAQGIYASTIMGAWIWEQIVVGPATAAGVIQNTDYTFVPTDGRTPISEIEAAVALQLTAGKNPNGAWDFLSNYLETPKNVEYLLNWPNYAVGSAGADLAAKYCDTNGMMADQITPYHSTNLETGVTTNWWQPKWLDMANNHSKRPAATFWTQINTLIGTHVDNCINGTETAAQASSMCASDIVSYLKSIEAYSES